MKNLLYYFLALTLVIASCGKDKDSDNDGVLDDDDACPEVSGSPLNEGCPCDDLNTTLIGSWEVTVFPFAQGDVEFKANGDLIDADNTFPVTGGVTLDRKTYSIESDSTFTVRLESSATPAIFVEYDVTVRSFTCDEMDITVLGVNGTMERNE